MVFLRYEAVTPNDRGVHIGIFGLVNGLAHSGLLTVDERRWWRAANDWFNQAYPDPADVDPSLFDRSVHPEVSCWFKADATHLLERIPGHLALLDRHDIPWIERRSTNPGRVLYEDSVQIVCAPEAVV